MKREIKFRIWDALNNRMLTAPVYCLELLCDIVANVASKKMYFPNQFIGIADKNGKDIFEGDIINCPEMFNKKYTDCFGVVKYHEDRFIIEWITETLWNDSIRVRVKDIEIVGNIYENPEMLVRKN